MKKDGFTLIELLIAVSILSVMMVFLYQSTASLNKSNAFYKKKIEALLHHQKIKKTILLDYTLANSIKILPQEKDEDVVFLQTRHSIHKNYNPYIAYIKKHSKLYRLESLTPFSKYPLSEENHFIVDFLGKVNSFRVYKSKKEDTNQTSTTYLLHIDFQKANDILMKLKPLNE